MEVMEQMERTRQPAMPPPTAGMQPGSRPDLGPEERTAGTQAFKKSSALTRWGILVACAGLGTAAVIAIVMAAVFTLVESSL